MVPVDSRHTGDESEWVIGGFSSLILRSVVCVMSLAFGSGEERVS